MSVVINARDDARFCSRGSLSDPACNVLQVDAKDIEYLSRVVDRHLRSLKAFPDSQAKSKGNARNGDLNTALGLGALMERVERF